MNNFKQRLVMAIPVVGTVISFFGVLSAHAQDYLVTATDTIPIFQNTAAGAKSNGLAILGVGLPYFVDFMIALVILALVLLPIRKIWGAMHF